MISVILGLALGLLSATCIESFGHRIFGHPSRLQLKLYFKYPKFFAPFLRAYYQHLVIHHGKTYQVDILTQFKDAEEKNQVDTWIAQQFPENFANLIWKERYNLTLEGVEGTLPFAIPFTTGPIIIAYFFGPTAFVASLLTAYIPVLMSKFIHPLIHHPEDIETSHPIVRAISRTKYMQKIFQNHFLHHKRMDTNFNLLLGGDYILGVHETPTEDESVELENLLYKFGRKIGS
ncbi:MAG: hypothetical protein V4736_07420 [Bdellovibrionota bacterium]